MKRLVVKLFILLSSCCSCFNKIQEIGTLSYKTNNTLSPQYPLVSNETASLMINSGLSEPFEREEDKNHLLNTSVLRELSSQSFHKFPDKEFEFEETKKKKRSLNYFYKRGLRDHNYLSNPSPGIRKESQHKHINNTATRRSSLANSYYNDNIDEDAINERFLESSDPEFKSSPIHEERLTLEPSIDGTSNDQGFVDLPTNNNINKVITQAEHEQEHFDQLTSKSAEYSIFPILNQNRFLSIPQNIIGFQRNHFITPEKKDPLFKNGNQNYLIKLKSYLQTEPQSVYKSANFLNIQLKDENKYQQNINSFLDFAGSDKKSKFPLLNYSQSSMETSKKNFGMLLPSIRLSKDNLGINVGFKNLSSLSYKDNKTILPSKLVNGHFTRNILGNAAKTSIKVIKLKSHDPLLNNNIIIDYAKQYSGRKKLVVDFSKGAYNAELILYPLNYDKYGGMISKRSDIPNVNDQSLHTEKMNEDTFKRMIGDFGINRWVYFGLDTDVKKFDIPVNITENTLSLVGSKKRLLKKIKNRRLEKNPESEKESKNMRHSFHHVPKLKIGNDKHKEAILPYIEVPNKDLVKLKSLHSLPISHSFHESKHVDSDSIEFKKSKLNSSIKHKVIDVSKDDDKDDDDDDDDSYTPLVHINRHPGQLTIKEEALYQQYMHKNQKSSIPVDARDKRNYIPNHAANRSITNKSVDLHKSAQNKTSLIDKVNFQSSQKKSNYSSIYKKYDVPSLMESSKYFQYFIDHPESVVREVAAVYKEREEEQAVDKKLKLAEQNADKRFSGTLQPLDALYHSYKFPNQPNSKGVLNNFDAPTQVGYQYGQLLWGWFIAPLDGEYIFFSACDDACDIYMSPDEGKDHIRKIISQNQWSLHNEFDKYPEEQTSIGIRLSRGRAYYIQAVGAQSTGRDCLSVGVQLPTGVLVRPITRHFLSRTPIGSNGHFHMSPGLAAAQEADIQISNDGFSGLANNLITPGVSAENAGRKNSHSFANGDRMAQQLGLPAASSTGKLTDDNGMGSNDNWVSNSVNGLGANRVSNYKNGMEETGTEILNGVNVMQPNGNRISNAGTTGVGLDNQKTSSNGNKVDLSLDDTDVTSALNDFRGLPGNTAGTQGASLDALSLNHKESGDEVAIVNSIEKLREMVVSFADRVADKEKAIERAKQTAMVNVTLSKLNKAIESINSKFDNAAQAAAAAVVNSGDGFGGGSFNSSGGESAVLGTEGGFFEGRADSKGVGDAGSSLSTNMNHEKNGHPKYDEPQTPELMKLESILSSLAQKVDSVAEKVGVIVNDGTPQIPTSQLNEVSLNKGDSKNDVMKMNNAINRLALEIERLKAKNRLKDILSSSKKDESLMRKLSILMLQRNSPTPLQQLMNGYAQSTKNGVSSVDSLDGTVAAILAAATVNQALNAIKNAAKAAGLSGTALSTAIASQSLESKTGLISRPDYLHHTPKINSTPEKNNNNKQLEKVFNGINGGSEYEGTSDESNKNGNILNISSGSSFANGLPNIGFLSSENEPESGNLANILGGQTASSMAPAYIAGLASSLGAAPGAMVSNNQVFKDNFLPAVVDEMGVSEVTDKNIKGLFDGLSYNGNYQHTSEDQRVASNQKIGYLGSANLPLGFSFNNNEDNSINSDNLGVGFGLGWLNSANKGTVRSHTPFISQTLNDLSMLSPHKPISKLTDLDSAAQVDFPNKYDKYLHENNKQHQTSNILANLVQLLTDHTKGFLKTKIHKEKDDNVASLLKRIPTNLLLKMLSNTISKTLLSKDGEHLNTDNSVYLANLLTESLWMPFRTKKPEQKTHYVKKLAKFKPDNDNLKEVVEIEGLRSNHMNHLIKNKSNSYIIPKSVEDKTKKSEMIHYNSKLHPNVSAKVNGSKPKEKVKKRFYQMKNLLQLKPQGSSVDKHVIKIKKRNSNGLKTQLYESFDNMLEREIKNDLDYFMKDKLKNATLETKDLKTHLADKSKIEGKPFVKKSWPGIRNHNEEDDEKKKYLWDVADDDEEWNKNDEKQQQKEDEELQLQEDKDHILEKQEENELDDYLNRESANNYTYMYKKIPILELANEVVQRAVKNKSEEAIKRDDGYWHNPENLHNDKEITAYENRMTALNKMQRHSHALYLEKLDRDMDSDEDERLEQALENEMAEDGYFKHHHQNKHHRRRNEYDANDYNDNKDMISTSEKAIQTLDEINSPFLLAPDTMPYRRHGYDRRSSSNYIRNSSFEHMLLEKILDALIAKKLASLQHHAVSELLLKSAFAAGFHSGKAGFLQATSDSEIVESIKHLTHIVTKMAEKDDATGINQMSVTQLSSQLNELGEGIALLIQEMSDLKMQKAVEGFNVHSAAAADTSSLEYMISPQNAVPPRLDLADFDTVGGINEENYDGVTNAALIALLAALKTRDEYQTAQVTPTSNLMQAIQNSITGMSAKSAVEFMNSLATALNKINKRFTKFYGVKQKLSKDLGNEESAFSWGQGAFSLDKERFNKKQSRANVALKKNYRGFHRRNLTKRGHVVLIDREELAKILQNADLNFSKSASVAVDMKADDSTEGNIKYYFNNKADDKAFLKASIRNSTLPSKKKNDSNSKENESDEESKFEKASKVLNDETNGQNKESDQDSKISSRAVLMKLKIAQTLAAGIAAGIMSGGPSLFNSIENVIKLTTNSAQAVSSTSSRSGVASTPLINSFHDLIEEIVNKSLSVGISSVSQSPKFPENDSDLLSHALTTSVLSNKNEVQDTEVASAYQKKNNQFALLSDAIKLNQIKELNGFHLLPERLKEPTTKLSSQVIVPNSFRKLQNSLQYSILKSIHSYDDQKESHDDLAQSASIIPGYHQIINQKKKKKDNPEVISIGAIIHRNTQLKPEKSIVGEVRSVINKHEFPTSKFNFLNIQKTYAPNKKSVSKASSKEFNFRKKNFYTQKARKSAIFHRWHNGRITSLIDDVDDDSDLVSGDFSDEPSSSKSLVFSNEEKNLKHMVELGKLYDRSKISPPNATKLNTENFSGEFSDILARFSEDETKKLVKDDPGSHLNLTNRNKDNDISVLGNEDDLFSNVELKVIYGDKVSNSNERNCSETKNCKKKDHSHKKSSSLNNSQLRYVILSHSLDKNAFGLFSRRNRTTSTTSSYSNGDKTVTYTTETKNGKTKTTKTVTYEDSEDGDRWTNGKLKGAKYDSKMYDTDKNHDFLIDVNDYNGDKNDLDISDKALHSGKISNYNPKHKAKLKPKSVKDTRKKMKTVSYQTYSKNDSNVTKDANKSELNGVINAGENQENHVNYNNFEYFDNGVNYTLKIPQKFQNSNANTTFYKEKNKTEIIPLPGLGDAKRNASDSVQLTTSTPGLVASTVNAPWLTESTMNAPMLSTLTTDNPGLAEAAVKVPAFTGPPINTPGLTTSPMGTPMLTESIMTAPGLKQNNPLLNAEFFSQQQNLIFQSQTQNINHHIPENEGLYSALQPSIKKPAYQNRVQPIFSPGITQQTRPLVATQTPITQSQPFNPVYQFQSPSVYNQPFAGHQGFANASIQAPDIIQANVPSNILQSQERNIEMANSRVMNSAGISGTSKKLSSEKSMGAHVEKVQNFDQSDKTYLDDGILTIEEESVKPTLNTLFFQKVVKNKGNLDASKNLGDSAESDENESDLSGYDDDQSSPTFVKYRYHVLSEAEKLASKDETLIPDEEEIGSGKNALSSGSAIEKADNNVSFFHLFLNEAKSDENLDNKLYFNNDASVRRKGILKKIKDPTKKPHKTSIPILPLVSDGFQKFNLTENKQMSRISTKTGQLKLKNEPSVLTKIGQSKLKNDPLNEKKGAQNTQVETRFVNMLKPTNQFIDRLTSQLSRLKKSTLNRGGKRIFSDDKLEKVKKSSSKSVKNITILKLPYLKLNPLFFYKSNKKRDDIPRYTRVDTWSNSKRRNELVPRYRSYKEKNKKFFSETMVKRGHVIRKRSTDNNEDVNWLRHKDVHDLRYKNESNVVARYFQDAILKEFDGMELFKKDSIARKWKSQHVLNQNEKTQIANAAMSAVLPIIFQGFIKNVLSRKISNKSFQPIADGSVYNTVDKTLFRGSFISPLGKELLKTLILQKYNNDDGDPQNSLLHFRNVSTVVPRYTPSISSTPLPTISKCSDPPFPCSSLKNNQLTSDFKLNTPLTNKIPSVFHSSIVNAFRKDLTKPVNKSQKHNKMVEKMKIPGVIKKLPRTVGHLSPTNKLKLNEKLVLNDFQNVIKENDQVGFIIVPFGSNQKKDGVSLNINSKNELVN